MAILRITGSKIIGLSAVVPKKVVDNLENDSGLFTKQELQNTVNTTGIRFRRIASPDVCSSDLCYTAANKLLNEMVIDRSSIDLLIFMSQTPDYRQPATAAILQNKLGLSTRTAAFDINLACSGYIFGLSTAFSYCSQMGINRALLLVGETLSRIVSTKDRVTSLLFGDGATATLIEKDESAAEAYFSLNSDGSGYEVLHITGGGYRNPSSQETLRISVYPDGSERNQEHLFMDGMEVFNFTMREVTKDINKLFETSKISIEDIDYVVFHQANKIITDFILKKMKIPPDKAPYSMYKFGNTSAVSIPLTIVSELRKELTSSKANLLLTGFGGGLSWGSSFLVLDKPYITGVIEV